MFPLWCSVIIYESLVLSHSRTFTAGQHQPEQLGGIIGYCGDVLLAQDFGLKFHTLGGGISAISSYELILSLSDA